MAELIPLTAGNYAGVRHAGNRSQGGFTTSGAQPTLGGAAGTLPRNPPLMNEEAYIVRLNIPAGPGTDTYTPFPTTGFPRSIVAYAVRPVNANEEAGVTYTNPTATAAGFFTIYSTAGATVDFYYWAR